MRMRTGALVLGVALLGGACKDSFVPNYNNPVQQDYTVVKSRAQLQSQITGLVDADRGSNDLGSLHDFEILIEETIGRDMYRLDNAEPRYITTPLGSSTVSTTNFIGSGIFTGPYRNIRYAELLDSAVANAAINEAVEAPLSDEEKQGVYGLAGTMKALQYIRLIETRDEAGVPIALGFDTDPDPIRCKPAVLDYISAVLDSAAANLSAAGDEFAFELPPGFSNHGTFDTPPTFLKFNRALKAKVEVYRAFANYASDENSVNTDALAAAQAALDASFYDQSGDLTTGVYHTYSTASGDLANPLFDKSVMRVNPRVVDEAQPNDRRLPAKVDTTTASVDANTKTVRDATSGFLDKVYTSPLTPIAIIRNEELIYLAAEIQYGYAVAGDDAGRLQDALDLVNRIRTDPSVGLAALQVADVTDAATPEEQQKDVIRQILTDKRYSLLFESPSRHIDFRMFGILNELGQERDFDPIHNLPIPANEALARGGDITCQP